MKKKENGLMVLVIAFLLLATVILLYNYARPLVIEPLVVPENITILSPSQPYYSSANILINVSVPDLVQALNVALNGSQVASCQNCSHVENSLSLGDGDYVLDVQVVDPSGNASKSFPFSVDTFPPLLSFDALTPVQGSMLNNSLYVGIVLTESHFSQVTYSLFFVNASAGNASVLVNSTTFYQPVLFLNYSLINNGTYVFNVSVLDKVGKVNQTETRSVMVSYACTPQWTPHTVCNASDSSVTSYTDSNTCGAVSPAQSISACDFCVPNWLPINTTCNNSAIITYYYDSQNCYAATNLSSDNQPPTNRTSDCGSSPSQTTTQTTTQNTQTPAKNTTSHTPTVTSVSETALSSELKITLYSNDIIRLNFSGNHVIKAQAISGNNVNILLDSQSILFFSDDKKEFDLDKDDVNDLSLTIGKISGGSVPIILKKIVNENTTTVIQETNATSFNEQPGISEQTLYKITGGIIAGILIIVFGIWITLQLMHRKPSAQKKVELKKDVKEKVKEKPVKPKPFRDESIVK